MQGLTGVHGHEVAGDVAGQTFTHRLERPSSRRQCFKMTEVGDDQLVPLVVGLIGRGEQILQGVNALSL